MLLMHPSVKADAYEGQSCVCLPLGTGGPHPSTIGQLRSAESDVVSTATRLEQLVRTCAESRADGAPLDSAGEHPSDDDVDTLPTKIQKYLATIQASSLTESSELGASVALHWAKAIGPIDRKLCKVFRACISNKC